MGKLMWGVVAVCLLCTVLVAGEEPSLIRQVTSTKFNEHRILDLPGAPSVSFSMHSGYITVDEEAGRALFYWFVEADVEDPTSAPLTLWLNGGPGCSSIGGGALSELGPFYPDKEGKTLLKNPYSWNKVSNLIFLESPAGVGFSYSNTTSDYTTGDGKTAEDSYEFLVRFLELYPEYAKSPFYITGESYAGHYVPQLAATILEKSKGGEFAINLKGIGVGNAWTDTSIDNFGAIFYWWSHALISDSSFYGMAKTCNFSVYDPTAYYPQKPDVETDDEKCIEHIDRANVELCNLSMVGPLRNNLQASPDLQCFDYIDAADREMGNIWIYEIYADVCLGAHAQAETKHFAKQLNRKLPGGLGGRPLMTNEGYDPCIDNEVEAYLNQPVVQKALHANVTGLPYIWTDCSNIVDYSNDDLLSSVLPTYHTLLESDLRIFIFSGDTDAIVPVTGTRAWINRLDLKVKEEWRPYYVANQVGGYVTVYDRLTFATVRGAGHMVPYTQPARGLHLFDSFINETPL